MQLFYWRTNIKSVGVRRFCRIPAYFVLSHSIFWCEKTVNYIFPLVPPPPPAVSGGDLLAWSRTISRLWSGRFLHNKIRKCRRNWKIINRTDSDTNVECCGLLQINQIEGHHHLVGSLATVMFDVWRSNRTKITDVFGRGCKVTDEVKIFLVLNNEWVFNDQMSILIDLIASLMKTILRRCYHCITRYVTFNTSYWLLRTEDILYVLHMALTVGIATSPPTPDIAWRISRSE